MSVNLKKSFVPFYLVIALFGASYAHAEADAKERHHNGSFTRQTDQQATANGFTRKTTTTNASGQTAVRSTEVVTDKAAGTRTRNVNGTNFKGETYAESSTTHKTANGYASNETFTGTDGKTTRRSVDAVVDKSAGTVTKNISTTPPSGQTTNKTIVKPLHKGHK